MLFGLAPIIIRSGVRPLPNKKPNKRPNIDPNATPKSRASTKLKSTSAVYFLFATGGLTLSGSAVAFPDGPEPGLTGGKGFEDCSSCHFAGPPPSTGSGIELKGLAEHMVPGERYQIVIEVRDPAQQVGGFQLAVRDLATLQSDGELVEGPGLRTLVANDVSFLSHSEPQRAAPTDDHQRTRWQFEWVAGKAQTVEVSVAAVAADGDDSALGDNVYTFSRIISTN